MAPDTFTPSPAASTAHTGQCVRDLPVPPDLATVIEAVCSRGAQARGPWHDWLADELKLQYHYGGKTVAVTRGERGLVVLVAGDGLDSPEIAGLRESLTPAENERTFLETLPRWDGDATRPELRR